MDWDSLMDCQGAQSQKGGQQDQGALKLLEATPLALLPRPGSPSLRSGVGLAGNSSGSRN